VFWAVLGCVLLLLVGGLAGLAWFAAGRDAGAVNVNFITLPYGAQVEIDGAIMASGGEAYLTPCTIPGLTAERHRIILRHPEFGTVAVGHVDFARVREVSVDWGPD
jgi:hypothetical protein